MSVVKIVDFAKQIGLDPDRLVKQLSDAGVAGKKSDGFLSDKEKIQLLEFLRDGFRARHERGKITLRKPAKSEAFNTSNKGATSKKIQVQTKKNRTFVKREELEEIEKNEAARDLIASKKLIENLKQKLDNAEENLLATEKKFKN